MDSIAVVLEGPERLALRRLALAPAGADDVVVEVDFSAVSAGTEKLLWTGRMPPFPGMGYPLVPGYEAVGRVIAAGPGSGRLVGEEVFVPGSSGFLDARGLFGAAARRLVLPGRRAIPLPKGLAAEGALLALAATARHAIVGGAKLPELVVGHGVLGRLIARIAVALGAEPTVWEIDPVRRTGAQGYAVCAPGDDPRADYPAICDASGAHGVLDQLIARLARGGEVCLAGFYEQPVSFVFPPAFMREARLRIAAEFTPDDVHAVLALIAEGRLRLDGLVTDMAAADEVASAYAKAFTDPSCLKMIIDWRGCA